MPPMDDKNDTYLNTILDTLNERVYRITMGREAFRAFLFTYFARSITYRMAKFHYEIIDILQDAKKNLVLTAFRGSGKSTLVTLAYAIWSIVGIHEKKFVVIVAQTEDRAQQCLKRVKDALLTSELLRNDFGAFEEPRDEWRANAINIPRFNARIAVLSVGQNIRGFINKSNRPDLMIFDDIEDTYTAKTKEARDKTFGWLTTEAFPAGDKNTRIIVVGNKVHEDASVLRLKELIAEGKWNGEYKEYPLLGKSGAIVWPGKYPDKKAVERERKQIGNDPAFRREFLLEIVPEEGQVVFREMLHYYDALPDPATAYFRFLALGVDLAISEKKSADYTAIVCASIYGRGRLRKIYIHPHPLNKRMNFPETIEEIKKVARTMQYDVLPRIFVESVGYQLSAVEQLRLEGYPAEPFLPRGDDKRSRLITITSLIESGQILFPKNGAEQLIGQLIGFGIERHDDLIDAFTLLIHKVLEHERISPPNNQPRIVPEYLLKNAYAE